jgi:hypothetical protein
LSWDIADFAAQIIFGLEYPQSEVVPILTPEMIFPGPDGASLRALVAQA